MDVGTLEEGLGSILVLSRFRLGGFLAAAHRITLAIVFVMASALADARRAGICLRPPTLNGMW